MITRDDIKITKRTSNDHTFLRATVECHVEHVMDTTRTVDNTEEEIRERVKRKLLQVIYGSNVLTDLLTCAHQIHLDWIAGFPLHEGGQHEVKTDSQVLEELGEAIELALDILHEKSDSNIKSLKSQVEMDRKSL